METTLNSDLRQTGPPNSAIEIWKGNLYKRQGQEPWLCDWQYDQGFYFNVTCASIVSVRSRMRVVF